MLCIVYYTFFSLYYILFILYILYIIIYYFFFLIIYYYIIILLYIMYHLFMCISIYMYTWHGSQQCFGLSLWPCHDCKLVQVKLRRKLQQLKIDFCVMCESWTFGRVLRQRPRGVVYMVSSHSKIRESGSFMGPSTFHPSILPACCYPNSSELGPKTAEPWAKHAPAQTSIAWCFPMAGHAEG